MTRRPASPRPRAPNSDKARRLAEALRANLARRKEQKRAREAAAAAATRDDTRGN